MANRDRIVRLFEPGQPVNIQLQGDDDYLQNDDYDPQVYRYFDQDGRGILVKDEDAICIFIPWSAIKLIRFV
jgi:hypothetical protein